VEVNIAVTCMGGTSAQKARAIAMRTVSVKACLNVGKITAYQNTLKLGVFGTPLTIAVDLVAPLKGLVDRERVLACIKSIKAVKQQAMLLVVSTGVWSALQPVPIGNSFPSTDFQTTQPAKALMEI